MKISLSFFRATVCCVGFAAMLLVAVAAQAASVIIEDHYDVVASGTGFALGKGVNSGINPPTTRLTGEVASGLRYIKSAGAKADSAHSIVTNKLQVERIASESSTLVLSPDGAGAFDYGTALRTLSASPSQPAVYEVRIKMSNNSAGTQRASFALGSSSGTAGAWDFGIQIQRSASGSSEYSLVRRISAGASSTGTALNSTVLTSFGTFGAEVPFLIRVTDAGAETSSFSSRVQVSMDDGATWVYDSAGDPEISNQWRLPGAGRFFIWDVAPSSGPVTYDDFSVTWISGPPRPLARVWSGSGADNNWSTAANWQGGIAPALGDMLVFEGTARKSNANNLTGFVSPWLTFNADGFALSGNPLTLSSAITNVAGKNTLNLDLGWTSAGPKFIHVMPGAELVIANPVTVEVAGDQSVSGGGVLRLKNTMSVGQATTVNPALLVNDGQVIVDSAVLSSRGGVRLGAVASAPTGGQLVLTNGATMSLTAAAANLRVGDSANPVTSRLALNDSTLTMAGGIIAVPYAARATGEVAQVGSTITGARVSFSDAGAGSGSFLVKNATLGVYQIRENTAAGLSAMYFDNALLQALSGATNAFMAGLDVAEIQAGGLAIDAQSDVTIAQNLSGVGALTNLAGNLTLLGTNSFTGPTVVAGGKLILPTGRTHASTIRVADNAALTIFVESSGATLTNSALTLGTSTLTFDLGAFGNPANPLLKVGSLAANGTVNVELRKSGAGLTVGKFVLIDYDGTIGGGAANFKLVSVPDGVTAALVNNTTTTALELNITSVPGYRWTGAQSTMWDNTSLNWINKQSGQAAVYADGSPVEFLDGPSRTHIELAIQPMPSAVIVSNSASAFSLSGNAIISPLLRKSGTNSLMRVMGEADLITQIELNEGALIVSNIYDAPLASELTDVDGGAGTLVKMGPNAMTLSVASPDFDGGIVVREGTLMLGVNGLGSTNGTTVIEPGATLDLNNMISPHEPVVVSGQGVGGIGAIIDSTSATGVAHNLTDVVLTGDTTFGCPAGGRWDLRVRAGSGPGPGLRGNSYNLTKVGSGHVSIAAQRHNYGTGVPVPYWDMNLGNVYVNEGTLTFAESVTPGNPSRTITVAPGATLATYDLNVTNPILRTVIMADASLASGGGGTDATNVYNGPMQLTGANHFRLNNDSRLIINGAISGSGALDYSDGGAGMLLLNGANTFAGDLMVTNGTLSGGGSIAHNLVMLGGTLAPGQGVGTFTVGGSATLGGSTVMEVDSGSSDRLVVSGALTFGGALQVVLAGTPQPGDVYQLFNKAGSGTFTSVALPDLTGLPGNMSWDQSALYVNGSIKVNGTALPPKITSVSQNGSALTVSGSGGTEGATYYVVTSPTVSAPLPTWTPLYTNVFGAGGTFSFSTEILGNAPASFFRLKLP